VTWNALESRDIRLDMTADLALAHDVTALCDRMNLWLCANQLVKSTSAATPTSYYHIWAYLNSLPMRLGTTNEAADRQQRLNDVITLMTSAPEFNVQK
jgi:hypothetical protein